MVGIIFHNAALFWRLSAQKYWSPYSLNTVRCLKSFAPPKQHIDLEKKKEAPGYHLQPIELPKQDSSSLHVAEGGIEQLDKRDANFRARRAKRKLLKQAAAVRKAQEVEKKRTERALRREEKQKGHDSQKKGIEKEDTAEESNDSESSSNPKRADISPNDVSSPAKIPSKDPRSREARASMNAKTVKEARQVQESTGGYKARDTFLSAYSFESTKLVYPPKDVYPPHLPRVAESDLLLAARALGVHKVCELEWNANTSQNDASGEWRRMTRIATYYEENGMLDYIENEQDIEFIGDSTLHLITRTLLLHRFPRRSIHSYNMAANFMVSNDSFGYMYDDAGLGMERERIASMLLHYKRDQEIKRVSMELSPEDLEVRKCAPLPKLNLGDVLHSRKADHFEAFVGAVYLTFGYDKTLRWATALFEPVLDRVGRTFAFQENRNRNPAGEAQDRIEKFAIRAAELRQAERLERQVSELGLFGKTARRALHAILPQSLFPELTRQNPKGK